MLQEVPCRDTDPDPGLAMDIKVKIKALMVVIINDHHCADITIGHS